MFQLEHVQLFGVGMAAAIDTALLLVLVNRHNWRRVVLPMVLLVAGAWLLHIGTFVHALLEETGGSWAAGVHWLAMMAMALGLLIMPSSILHFVMRLGTTGFDVQTTARARYALAYLPVMVLIPSAWLLAADPRGAFLTLLSPLVLPYVVWHIVVYGTSAVGFLLLRTRFDLPRARTFLTVAATALAGLAAVHAFVFLIGVRISPALQAHQLLIVVLSPVVLALLLAYFILRHNFMHLVIERTIVYGVMVIGLLLFQRILLRTVWINLSERYQVDFVIVAGVFLCALVLLHRPLRQRTAEALRYLMGERIARVREQTRRLSLEMSTLSGQPPGELIDWFVELAGVAFGVSYVNVWLIGSSGEVTTRGAGTQRLDDESVVKSYRDLTACRVVASSCRDAPTQCVEYAMYRAEASLAVTLDHPNVAGLVLLGCRKRNRELSEEQIGAVVMLTEQLGITLNNSMLQADRIAAERRALQQEKLSTLGLIASSIAHEVKNPLSSIKTIATVLREEIGPSSPHDEDIRLILGEVDRLSANVTQLLQFARPADGLSPDGSVMDVLADTMRLMRHFATQRSVSVASELPIDLPSARGNENAIREIFLNLISNSIDAAGEGGRVTVSARCHSGHLVVDVRDTGPGIPPECQDRLFEPFVTTKQAGTGLGLYVVGRRVRELGGEVGCQTGPGIGTIFTVRFPVGAA